MHIADFSVGMLGANGIVAGGLGIAVGAALASRLRGTDRIAVSFFSDGATARGPFAESLNLAQLWRLPVLFVCENNGWASTTRSEEALAQPQISVRSAALGMHSVTVDGNDVFAVYEATVAAVERARRDDGPTLLEAATYRLRGHFVGDSTSYRDRGEVAAWVGNDPLERAARRLLAANLLSREQRTAIDAAARAEVDEAVDQARSAPRPAPGTAAAFLFADDLPADRAPHRMEGPRR